MEEATEGSTALEANVARAFGVNVTYSAEINPKPCGDDGNYLPPWTRSLDAAIALVREKLPGWTWSITQETETHYYAELSGPNWGKGQPALALILALVTALERE